MKPVQQKETALRKAGPQAVLAAETANLAENLPDGAALGIASEEEHLADLLISIASRRHV